MIAEYEETQTSPTTPRWMKSYVYFGGRLLATIAPNGQSERVEYHHPDRLGTRLVTNNQDTSSFEQATLPFGTALDAESTGSTKRRFTSYDRSTVTGLDYAVNRHYDPLQGRFTQVDPIGMASVSLSSPQTLNLYAYCANDPINQTDPSGLGFFSFLGKVFSFFAKIAKWVAVVVAVAVLVAVAFPAFAPILGTILFNTGIWQLGAGVSASFLTGGAVAAGIGIGATGFVIGGVAAVGAVNDFLQQKRTERRKRESLGARIAQIAAANVGSKAWRTSKPRGKAPAESNKCSLFVYDVLKRAGAPAPTSGGKGVWPAQAGDWGNPNIKNLQGWTIVTDGSLHPGDVIAEKALSSSPGVTGHVAIIGPDLWTYGTGIEDGIISRTNWGLRLGQGRWWGPILGQNPKEVVIRRCNSQ